MPVENLRLLLLIQISMKITLRHYIISGQRDQTRKWLWAILKKTPLDGDDYAKDVRTRVVLFWMIANLVFIMTMVQVYEPGDTGRNIYLAFIFVGSGSVGSCQSYWLSWILDTNICTVLWNRRVNG